jgi:hypothetical protein
MKNQLFILSAAVIIGLSGCGSDSNNENHSSSNNIDKHEEMNHGENHKEMGHEGHNAHEKPSEQDTSQVKFSFDKTPVSKKENLLTIQVNQ